MSPRKSRVFDKVKWHEDGSAVLPGVFLGWAVRSGLTSDEIAPNDERAVKAGKLSGEGLLAVFDGVLSRDLFSPEGQRFADHHYATGQYSTDALRAVPALAGRGPARITKAALRAVDRALDARLAAWKDAAVKTTTTTSKKPATKPATRPAKKATAKPATRPTAKPGASGLRAAEVGARLTRLSARARRRDVEVEHLLAFAQLGDARAAAPLRELAAEHGWPLKGRGVVPLGAWVDAVAIFLEAGAAGVARRVREKKLGVEVALGLLEEVPSEEAVKATLLLVPIAEKQRDAATLTSALGALQTLLDGDEPLLVAPATARELAHRQLERKLKPVDIASCYGILAAVGDATSLGIIAAHPPLRDPYKGCEKDAARAIKRRLGS